MYKIGEFSKLTMFTVKTLRYYDEQQILTPSYRSEENGYRFYSETELEKARLIKLLRDLEFSISELKEIINNYEDINDLKFFLIEKQRKVETKVLEQKKLAKKINKYISQIKKESEVNKVREAVIIKEIEPILVASIRFSGQYQDVEKYIGKIYTEIKGNATGVPLNLYYDEEYKELADIELCVPIKEMVVSNNFEVKELPKVKVVSIIHYGSYETLKSSYKVLMDYINENNLESYIPSREVYHKGPGMLFKGNEDKYKTEILIPIK